MKKASFQAQVACRLPAAAVYHEKGMVCPFAQGRAVLNSTLYSAGTWCACAQSRTGWCGTGSKGRASRLTRLRRAWGGTEGQAAYGTVFVHVNLVGPCRFDVRVGINFSRTKAARIIESIILAILRLSLVKQLLVVIEALCCSSADDRCNSAPLRRHQFSQMQQFFFLIS